MINRGEFRKDCMKNEIPIISKATEEFLRWRMIKNKPHSIAEIGSAVWYSTSVLANSMMSYTSYWSIDSREISYPHYRQSVCTTSHYRSVRVFLANICLVPLRSYAKHYDLLFIDWRKSETLFYLQQRISYINPLGYIIIDDVIKFKEKMQNLYLFLDSNKIEYTVKKLDDDDGILLIQVTQHLIQVLSSL